MSTETTWKTPQQGLPRRGASVVWTDSSGRETTGTFHGVWVMDNGMYIYYTPTKWRYA